LDGRSTNDFAPATGSANYVAKSGDTMTGTLTIVTSDDGLALDLIGRSTGQNENWVRFLRNDGTFGLQGGIRGDNARGLVLAGPAGSDDLVVAPGGNVGIGTTSPIDRLTLGYGDSLSLDANGSAQTTRLRWRYQGDEHAWIERIHATGDMAFAVGREERMRIDDPTGNVGIGRTQPFAALHLAREHGGPFDTGAGGQASIIVENIDAAANGGPSAVRLMRNGATRWAWVNDIDGNAADGLTLWQQGDFKRITVDTSGNLGIGTQPRARLDVVTGPARSSAVHVGEAVDEGIWFTSQTPDDHAISGGAELVSGNWIARNTSASLIALQDAKLEIYVNAGLTPGSAYTPTRRLTIDAGGNIGVGTDNPQSKLHVAGEAKVNVLSITGGADVAEPFEISGENIPKGAVVIIDEDHPGQLKLSDRAYDKRVAGIISGANGIQPGITLSQQGALEGGQNVALSGRVYALADATQDPIRPGDMLTTSTTPGHVMKASDPSQAYGAVIGKAMTGLKEGKGLVLVLVSLQ
jgi:hypothetical protein